MINGERGEERGGRKQRKKEIMSGRIIRGEEKDKKHEQERGRERKITRK